MIIIILLAIVLAVLGLPAWLVLAHQGEQARPEPTGLDLHRRIR